MLFEGSQTSILVHADVIKEEAATGMAISCKVDLEETELSGDILSER